MKYGKTRRVIKALAFAFTTASVCLGMTSCGEDEASSKNRQPSPGPDESTNPSPAEHPISSRPSPRPAGDALLVATFRADQLLAKAGASGALIDMVRALPGLAIPEVLAGLLREPAKLGIDLRQPVHLFVEKGNEANATSARFLCVTAGIADASVLSGHIEFFALLGMNKTVEDELTLGQFAQPPLAFGFDAKHFALVLAMEKEIEAEKSLSRLRGLFATDREPSPLLDEHLARPFDIGLYLRPEGTSLAPNFTALGNAAKLPPDLTTTTLRFNPGEIIVHFERFGSDKNASPSGHPAGQTVTLPIGSPEAGASLALAFEDNATITLATHAIRELLKSSWPAPIKMREGNATTMKNGQWLASWTGASSASDGSYLSEISLAGGAAEANSTKNTGEQNPLTIQAQLLNARFAIEVAFPKAVALLRSIPDPEPWRYDFVTFGEKLDRLSWSGDFSKSTLKLDWRDRESNGLASLADMIRQWQADRDGAELYAVIAGGDYEALKSAMEKVSSDLFDPKTGVSPLHFAAWQGRVRMLRYFIDKGIEVDAPDANGRTALHAACWSGKEETVRALLEQEANVDARNANGATPVMGAARIGHAGIVKILLEAGADTNATDQHAHGVMEYAAAGGRDAIVTLLSERNATIRSPLHVAAGTGDLDKLKQLLAEDRQVDEKDGWGGTALLFSASAGKLEALAFLLGKGADPSVSDRLGFTLVHAAAVSGDEQVLQHILELNPEINPRHKEYGSTPLDWALAGQDEVLAEMLRAKGGKTSWALGVP